MLYSQVKIAPSILSANFMDLKNQIKELEKVTDVLHLDVMDGHFVPNITFGPFLVKEIRAITKMQLDVHLMIENADFYIPEFAKAGADILTVHQEACTHLHRTIQLIKSLGIKAGVSLNPASHENTLDYILDDLNLILIMSVNPGFGGQKFISSVLPKLERIKNKVLTQKNEIILEVDGGVSKENAKMLVELGARYLVAGNAVFKENDLKVGVNNILHEAKKGL